MAAQLLGALGLAAGGTAGALLATHITGNEATAGLPLAMLVLGSGVGGGCRDSGDGAVWAPGRGWPPLTWQARWEPAWQSPQRRCTVSRCCWLAAGLLGGGNAAVMLARYAAADLSTTQWSGHQCRGDRGDGRRGRRPQLARLDRLASGEPRAWPARRGCFCLPFQRSLLRRLCCWCSSGPTRCNWQGQQEILPASTRGGLAALLADPHIRLALLRAGRRERRHGRGDGRWSGASAPPRRRARRGRPGDQRAHCCDVLAVAG